MVVFFDDTMRILNQSIMSIDNNMFEQLLEESVDTLARGNKIIATGLGKNVPICEKFVGTMNSLGQSSYFLHTNSAIHGDLGVVRENDIVIILTKSGETSESIHLAKYLKQKKANIWLLSFERNSTLAKTISKSIILDLEHEGDMWNIVPNNSTTLNLLVLQALAMNIVKRKNLTLDDFKINHPGGHIGEILHG